MGIMTRSFLRLLVTASAMMMIIAWSSASSVKEDKRKLDVDFPSKCVNDPNFSKGGKKKKKEKDKDKDKDKEKEKDKDKDKDKKKKKKKKKDKDKDKEKETEKEKEMERMLDMEKEGKDCEEYTKKNKNKKCRLKDVKESCPAICKMELCMCMDSEERIKYKKGKYTCKEILDKGLCKKGKLGNKCPISCGVECLN